MRTENIPIETGGESFLGQSCCCALTFSKHKSALLWFRPKATSPTVMYAPNIKWDLFALQTASWIKSHHRDSDAKTFNCKHIVILWWVSTLTAREHRELPHTLCPPPRHGWHIPAYPGPKSKRWLLRGDGCHSSATSRATLSPSGKMGKWTPPESEVWFLVISGWKWGCPALQTAWGWGPDTGSKNYSFRKLQALLLPWITGSAQPCRNPT